MVFVSLNMKHSLCGLKRIYLDPNINRLRHILKCSFSGKIEFFNAHNVIKTIIISKIL